MLEKFHVPHRTHLVGLYSGTMAQDLTPLEPARLVPVLKTPEGHVVGESLAMAETLAERHPQAGLWPQDATLRMRARWVCAEMASGFGALRSACPMQLQHVDKGFAPNDAVQADLARIETLWRACWHIRDEGDWLLGQYSLADVFYAPVAARIIGYDLPVSQSAKAYCLQVISDPTFKKWRKAGLEVAYDPFPYPTSGITDAWPIKAD